MDGNTMVPARAARHARIIRARFTLSEGLGGEMLIKNVSEGGLGCRCDCQHIRIGDQVSIDLPVVGERLGIVRWIEDNQCGIQMVEPLDVERLRFRPNTNLLSSPAPFSVAERYQPATKTYRPGLRSA